MARGELPARTAPLPAPAVVRRQGGQASREGQPPMSDENFLSRWSRRKVEARDAPAKPELPVEREAQEAEVAAPAQEPVPLPPVESLTPESDFTPFMQPDVDAGVKREALKKLFDDPRFNAMDGLDVYIDDYTKTTPIPEGLLEKMEQMRHLGIFKREEEPKDAPVAESPASESLPPGEKALQEQAIDAIPSVTSSERKSVAPVRESGVPKD
ncbi:MAG TPA: DUF3306 domain-containing protein [Usitatibacter sp.]|nr:DUF3306 domain-containing protein [Usitatibacter sp.]